MQWMMLWQSATTAIILYQSQLVNGADVCAFYARACPPDNACIPKSEPCPGQCAQFERLCKDEACKPVCDDVLCYSWEFRCAAGDQCIEGLRKCDSISDCWDASDEMECGESHHVIITDDEESVLEISWWVWLIIGILFLFASLSILVWCCCFKTRQRRRAEAERIAYAQEATARQFAFDPAIRQANNAVYAQGREIIASDSPILMRMNPTAPPFSDLTPSSTLSSSRPPPYTPNDAPPPYEEDEILNTKL